MARLIAIDLGSYAAKVTVFQGTGREHELEAEFVHPIPQDGTLIPNLADRLDALDQIKRRNPEVFDSGHIAEVLWSGDRSSVHRIGSPFTEAAVIEQTLPNMVEGEVPFELEEMALGWRAVSQDAESSQILVVLAAEMDIENLIDALSERALDPRRIVHDGDPLGVYAQYGDTTTAVIDVGHAHTTVSVARGGRTLASRSIGVGGRLFTGVIQSALDCSWGEAQALKHGSNEAVVEDDEEDTASGQEDHERTDPGVSGMPAKAREALYGAIGLLLAEVRTTLIQSEDQFGLEIDEIVLTGGGSQVPGLRKFLHQDIGVPVRDPEDTLSNSLAPGYAMSRALAHAMTGEHETEVVDLRVGELAYRGGLDMTRSVLTYGGALLGFFLAAVLAMFAYQLYDCNRQLAEVEARLAQSVQEAVGDVPDDMSPGGLVSLLAEMVGEAQEEADFLGDGTSKPPTIDLLYNITKAFPPHPTVEVNIDNMEITTNAIKIRGVTQGFAQVDSIQQSLQDAGLFRDVVATPGSRDRQGDLNFELDIDRTAQTDGDTDEPIDEDG